MIKIELIKILKSKRLEYLNDFGKYANEETYNPITAREKYILLKGKIQMLDIILNLLNEEKPKQKNS